MNKETKYPTTLYNRITATPIEALLRALERCGCGTIDSSLLILVFFKYNNKDDNIHKSENLKRYDRQTSTLMIVRTEFTK